jgi:hypothetical protein
MRKNIYEILGEFERANDDISRARVLLSNNTSPTLLNVLKLTFDPQYEFYIKEMPQGYKNQDNISGLSYSTLDLELRKLYLFQVGNKTADNLDPRRREELFINMMESLEPKEASVVLKIMNKDLGIPTLTKKFVKKVFPDLL